MDERHPAVRDKREFQAIRQGVNFDLLAAAARFASAHGSRRIERIQDGEREALLGEVGRSPPDIVRRHGLDRRDVAAGEIQIARLVPVRCEVRGPAGGRREAFELARRNLPLRLIQL